MIGRVVAVVLFAVMCLACFASGPSKISARAMNVATPSLMVATKSPRTAYVVLDPERVPSVLTILVDSRDRGGRIEDAHAFVERDIVKAFSNYFAKVEVVRPGQELPATPHAIIDTKVERVEVRVMGASGGVSHGYGAMTWGLGMRLSEHDEYMYSFAGESVGAATGDPNVAFRSMFEAAITDMLKGYTEKEVHAQVLKSSAPPSAPAASSTEI